jgi:hypothetical protein
VVRSTLRFAVFALLLLPALKAYSQAQEGIDRNLLERQQREVRFGVSLYDDVPPRPAAGAPAAPSMPITLYPPGISPMPERGSPPPVTLPPPTAQGRSAQRDLEQLHSSQQQRQLHLQLDTREQPEAVRRQQSQQQQLIFEREGRAQELGADIMRRSSEAAGAR